MKTVLISIISFLLILTLFKTFIQEVARIGLKAILTFIPKFIIKIFKFLFNLIKYSIYGVKIFISSFLGAIKNIIKGGEIR